MDFFSLLFNGKSNKKKHSFGSDTLKEQLQITKSQKMNKIAIVLLIGCVLSLINGNPILEPKVICEILFFYLNIFGFMKLFLEQN